MEKKNVLDNMINIPVTQPTRLNQCGTWNAVYPPDTEEKLTDWGKFKILHATNPAIYKSFCEISNTLIGRGFDHYSAYGVMHIVRFQTLHDMDMGDGFKVSDHMTPFFARLWLRDHPNHSDFFSIKPIRLQGFKERWIEELQ